ncbi:hypothetical protein GCM10027072_45520 [Streptomyces bullii]
MPGRGRWHSLSAGQQAVNRSHAKTRALGEQAMGTLKTWRVLRKARCGTSRDQGLASQHRGQAGRHLWSRIRNAGRQVWEVHVPCRSGQVRPAGAPLGRRLAAHSNVATRSS